MAPTFAQAKEKLLFPPHTPDLHLFGPKPVLALVIGLGLSVSSCSGQGAAQKALAQCQIDAFGVEGTTFRRNYAGKHYNAYAKDGAYREFILTCMGAAGFEFELPAVSSPNYKVCWFEDGGGGSLPDAYVDGAHCYSSGWW